MSQTMTEQSQETRDEYDGIRDCEQGLPCPLLKSKAYYEGYSIAYAKEQQESARSLANGY
jgi:hypothetical protein